MRLTIILCVLLCIGGCMGFKHNVKAIKKAARDFFHMGPGMETCRELFKNQEFTEMRMALADSFIFSDSQKASECPKAREFIHLLKEIKDGANYNIMLSGLTPGEADYKKASEKSLAFRTNLKSFVEKMHTFSTPVEKKEEQTESQNMNSNQKVDGVEKEVLDRMESNFKLLEKGLTCAEKMEKGGKKHSEEVALAQKFLHDLLCKMPHAFLVASLTNRETMNGIFANLDAKLDAKKAAAEVNVIKERGIEDRLLGTE